MAMWQGISHEDCGKEKSIGQALRTWNKAAAVRHISPMTFILSLGSVFPSFTLVLK